MITSPTISLGILSLIIAAFFILGSIVLFRNPKSATNVLFSLLTVSIVVWGVVNYFSYNVGGPENVLFFARLVLFFAVPFATFFFLLIHTFPHPELLMPLKQLGFFITLSFITMIVTLLPLTFKGITSVSVGVGAPIVGPGILLFGFTVLFYDIGGIVLLIKKMRRAEKEEYIQQLYLFIGIIFMLVSIIIFNFIFPTVGNNTQFIPFAAAFTFPFFVFTAYAIIKHHFLNITVIATEIITFIVVIGTLFQILASGNLEELIFAITLFMLVLVFGVLLIRSVLKEVQQREKLLTLAGELAQANKKLEQLDQQKSEFISIASHQFRAPLTVIKGYISLFLDGTFGFVIDELRNSLNLVGSISQELVETVNNLLEFSRLETGRIQYELKKQDFIETLKTVMDKIRPYAKKRELRLTLEENHNAFPVSPFTFDKERISHVLKALLDNAIRYSEKGDILIKVEAIRDSVNPYLRVLISDMGIGITVGDMPHIFTKFFRSEYAKKHNPQGLGVELYLAKRIIEDHGGKIWVESGGEGKGSTFVVELPMRQQ